MHSTDTHLEHSLTAAQSALSANRGKREIKEKRGEEREGWGERYRHQQRLRTLSMEALLFTPPLALLHKCDAKHASTWNGQLLRALLLALFFPSYICQLCLTEKQDGKRKSCPLLQKHKQTVESVFVLWVILSHTNSVSLFLRVETFSFSCILNWR